MAVPPLSAGANQETRADLLPRAAVTSDGGPGTVAGVTLLDGKEAGPVPTPFVAVTVNVYAVPFLRPFTVQESCPTVQPQVCPSGELVTV